jgi:rhamnulokinase
VVSRVFAAVDLGAASGRVVAGLVDGYRIDLREVHRFPNAAVEGDGHLRWDLNALYGQVLAGLAHFGDAESVGIDTWGVDYGLLDADGRLLAAPISYRDARTADVAERVHQVVAVEDMYAITGTQFLPFNTVYQLMAEQQGPLWSQASHAVLIPDLLAYWLTGRLRSEVTNASTTGLLDIRSGAWSRHLLAALALPERLLPDLEEPGSTRGVTETGTPVVTVGSHDTASAVVGVPATAEEFAYISCGTWSLVGLELDHPVLTPGAQKSNFTNELGVDGRTRFLRSVGGLWLLQECLGEWGAVDVEGLLHAAARRPRGGPLIDVTDQDLIPPGDMPSRISAVALGPGSSMERPAIVRCILDSLASAYAEALEQASVLTAKRIDVVHIVGGGSQNGLLCQLTADATERPVLAGPAEATAFGNVAVQARSRGALPESLEAIRAGIAAQSPPRLFSPR